MLAAALLLLAGDSVGPVPKEWGLNAWYAKGLEADGIRIAGSAKVSDAALIEAGRLTRILLRPIPKVRDAIRGHNIHVAVMASTEVTTDVPEYASLPKTNPSTNWNERARGLGAVAGYMLVSAAEENLLRWDQDRYRGESIFIHELSHAIMDFGLKQLDRRFEPRLNRAFDEAKAKGRWKDTYALTNLQEYWAEGVQSFFAANMEVTKPDGIHNGVNTPEELKKHDPPLYRLIESVFGKPNYRWLDEKR